MRTQNLGTFSGAARAGRAGGSRTVAAVMAQFEWD